MSQSEPASISPVSVMTSASDAQKPSIKWTKDEDYKNNPAKRAMYESAVLSVVESTPEKFGIAEHIELRYVSFMRDTELYNNF